MSWISYDISFCHSTDCPSAPICWRVQAQKEKDFPRNYYSVSQYKHKGDKCDSFIDVKEYKNGKSSGNPTITRKSKQSVKHALDTKEAIQRHMASANKERNKQKGLDKN